MNLWRANQAWGIEAESTSSALHEFLDLCDPILNGSGRGIDKHLRGANCKADIRVDELEQCCDLCDQHNTY